ncbi:hypothetical protein Bca4012_043769 [Brassica carinata]
MFRHFTINLLIGGYNSIDCHPHRWRLYVLSPFHHFSMDYLNSKATNGLPCNF